MSESFDVVIAGGGPAGSVCAAALVKRGLRVLVLEKARFPRFHLGESLLPGSMPILQEIGVLPKLQDRFIWKYGARFHEDLKGRKERFPFAGAWVAELDHAFQVPRDEFDQVLLEHAKSLGADVREAHTVTSLRRGFVEAKAPDGTSVGFEARFVIDATGRDAMMAHEARGTTKIGGLDTTAVFNQFRGVARPEGDLAGDIDIVLFYDEGDRRPNWFWFIPFKDGRTSVGAVVSRAWIQRRRGTVDELFDAAVKASPTATELLANAERLWPRCEATADFSYRVRDLVGDGWIAIGDAGGFIDPLFSTGAHLAMVGGKQAADAVAAVLADPSREREILAAWESTLRTGAETFLSAVLAFYAGPLVETLFAEDKHDVLKKSITSLLAGDVFTSAVWLRDARKRVAAMLETATP
jgi:flavin-dependent dehydrogenase